MKSRIILCAFLFLGSFAWSRSPSPTTRALPSEVFCGVERWVDGIDIDIAHFTVRVSDTEDLIVSVPDSPFKVMSRLRDSTFYGRYLYLQIYNPDAEVNDNGTKIIFKIVPSRQEQLIRLEMPEFERINYAIRCIPIVPVTSRPSKPS